MKIGVVHYYRALRSEVRGEKGGKVRMLVGISRNIIETSIAFENNLGMG